MAGFQEYEEYDALGLAALVRRKAVTPVELLDAAMARLARHNPRINAVCHVFEGEARARIAAGLPVGPFTGVPYLLKDLYALYAGQPTANGSRFYQGFVADHDSTLVERLKAAGLVIFGKTNTPEFGLSTSTEPALFGPSRNPWSLAHSAGGSSGGAAAAVAARLLPTAHATDGGGSIRIPAACCGLYGLKPTRGRNPAGPDVGEGWAGMAAAHAVTLSVRDSAALLDATAGPAVGDPYWAPPPGRRFLEALDEKRRHLRIAVMTKAPADVPVHPACTAAVEQAARLLGDLGHRIEPAAPTYEADLLRRAARDIICANVRNGLELRGKALGREPRPDDVEPITWAQAEQGRRLSAADYARATQTVHRISRQILAFFERHDMLLTPALAEPPLRLGELSMACDDLAGYLRRLLQFTPFTAMFNATGQPAAVLPFASTAEGLPIGVQLVARFGEEAELLKLSADLEAARPWFGRRPSLQ
ncbi:MAG: amidase [Alphaproteobacteria bacterium]|nr:amidase [Alphaproteobacteria bacterium]